MFFWPWKGKDHKLVRKAVGGGSGIIKAGPKNLGKKTPKGHIGKLPGKTPSNTERRKAYLNALSRYIVAAADFGQLDRPDEPFVNFGSTDIEDDTWHITRVPEGPQTHLVLAKSEPHRGANFSRNSSNRLMQHIYEDLHEVSFNGLIRYTIDLNPQLPQGKNVVSQQLVPLLCALADSLEPCRFDDILDSNNSHNPDEGDDVGNW